MIPTPEFNLSSWPDVYEPAEDSFLLLDCLEADAQLLREQFKAPVVAEVG